MLLKNIAVIGDGLIGKRLQKFVSPTKVFDSKNIDTLHSNEFETVYVAAPNSNRIWASQNPKLDECAVHQITQALISSNIKKIILISTCDTQVVSSSIYGKNRLYLENAICENFESYHIIRLPALIGNDIKKNILFDIKYKTKWLEQINLNVYQQWYSLDDLEQDIQKIINGSSNNSTIDNLVSEPILNIEILQDYISNFESFKNCKGNNYNIEPYKYTKEYILEKVRLYMRG